MFQLAEVNLLYLFLALPLLGLFIWLSEKGKIKALKKIARPQLLNGLLEQIVYPIRNVKTLLLFMSIALIVFSLARPQWGRKIFKIDRAGIDIVFLIDVSRSMLAEDIIPNRLEKAKIQLSSFLNQLKSDRVGLVVFAGESFVSCPLTLDFNALKIFIDQIDPGMIARQGTHLAEALAKARSMFNTDLKNHKAIVLLTDGEDHGTEPLEESEKCKKEGIRIYTIGIGKREGEPIPIKDEHGEIVNYIKDARGQVVMSRLDEVTLKQIANETGGKYVFSQSGELELKNIHAHMQSIEKKKLASQKMKRREERFGYFTLAALIFLTTEMLLSERRKRS